MQDKGYFFIKKISVVYFGFFASLNREICCSLGGIKGGAMTLYELTVIFRDIDFREMLWHHGRPLRPFHKQISYV